MKPARKQFLCFGCGLFNVPAARRVVQVLAVFYRCWKRRDIEVDEDTLGLAHMMCTSKSTNEVIDGFAPAAPRLFAVAWRRGDQHYHVLSSTTTVDLAASTNPNA
jgi:hypothetical protein